MLFSSNLRVEPAFPHSHSFKLTERVRDKWVKAEGQTLRTCIPPGGAQSGWGFLVTSEGIHEVHCETGRGIRTNVHCSPWIFNTLWLSGFILKRNLSQLGESVAHLGPAVSQQPLSPPASHWPRPRKPVIVHSLSVLSRLAQRSICLHLIPWILLGCAIHCWPASSFTPHLWTVFSASTFSVVFDQDHCILPPY